MFKKTKKFIANIKSKIKQKKKEQEESCITIEKLPEKVDFNLQLNEIVTFGFLFRTGVIILFLIYLGYIAANSLDLIYAIFTAFIISMALETTITFFSKYLYR
jgi:Sec-independent protein secretion pathway component TatC